MTCRKLKTCIAAAILVCLTAAVPVKADETVVSWKDQPDLNTSRGEDQISPKALLGSLSETGEGSSLLKVLDEKNGNTADTDLEFEAKIRKSSYKKNGFSRKELKYLACIIYCEANSQVFDSKVAVANTVLNTAVAEALKQFADKLEGAEDFTGAIHDLIKAEIKEHKRIIFNGNGYDASWIEEAEKRGLSNLKTTPDAVAHYLDKKNMDLMISHKVYSEAEMVSRHEVFLDKYCKLLHIEAQTMVEMATEDILPQVSAYSTSLADGIIAKKEVGADTVFESEILGEISGYMKDAYQAYKDLASNLETAEEKEDFVEKANYYKDVIIPDMDALRKACDQLETKTSAEFWPFPTYGDLLFAVR